MKKFYIAILVLVLFSLVATPVLTYAACGNGSALFGCGNINIGIPADKNPTEIATGIIKIAMSFLGLVAVCIMLYGGFVWMTAGGNEEKVGEAKKLIAAGIIGLIIIIASFSIVSFVLDKISGVVGVNGTNGS